MIITSDYNNAKNRHSRGPAGTVSSVAGTVVTQQ